MKKIYSIMMLVAAAAMAFSACQKQENFVPEVSSEEVLLTFASEKPALDDETKTEWTGETIQWSAGDKISVAYTVAGNWQNADGDASGDAKLYKSEALEAAAETAQFNVSTSFKGTAEGTHVFYGVYPAPSETGFADAPVATLTVPATQTPGATSFDGSADLMTGVSVGEFASRPDKGETISMKWTRLVAHANITLKALNGVTEGETISTITLTAQEGANLVGSQKVNIQTNEVTNNNEESNVAVLNGGNLAISAAGDVEFWACFLPETLTSLTVVVETNKATYTRNITDISKTFKQNARNTLSIKMNEATRMAKEEESWVLVTSAGELTDGTYVLVVKNTNTKKYTGALDTSNGSSKAPSLNQSVKVVDNTLTGVASSVQFDMTVVDGGYKFAVAGQTEDYLYANDDNNGVRIGTNANNVWTVTSDADMDYAYNLKNNATNRYLGVYETNPDWRCYTSLTTTNIKERNNEIYLYKKLVGPVVPDTTPSITVEETLELASAESEGTIAVTYKNLEALGAAAYADIECTKESDWLVALWENDAVTYVASENEGEERTAYIQIYALDSEANEYTEVITVIQKAYVDPDVVNKVTVAEFNALEGTETANYELTGVVSEIYQAYNSSYDNISFYIEDETGKVLIFRMDCAGDASLASLKVGDKVTVLGKPTLYNEVIQMAAGGVCTDHVVACNAPEISCDDNTVTIVAETGETIYYTTDGTDPTISSEQYSASFKITETKTVKAIAVAEGKAISVIASKVCMYVDPNADGKVPSSTACYTLTTSTAGSNNSYAGNCDITVDGITWNLTGNSTTSPWRMGGKDLSNVDRAVYSKTAYPSALSKVEFVSGTMNVTSWNSLKLEYSINADFADAQTIEASEVGASRAITFAPEGGFPANCYFRFVLNITVSGTSNKYIQLKNIIFYGYEN